MATVAMAYPDERFAPAYARLLAATSRGGRRTAAMDLLIATAAIIDAAVAKISRAWAGLIWPYRTRRFEGGLSPKSETRSTTTGASARSSQDRQAAGSPCCR